VANSVSVNLYKLIAAALAAGGPQMVLSEAGKTPICMIEGLAAQGLAEQRLAETADLEAALGDRAVLLRHVRSKTGDARWRG
jgi:kynureninase